MLQEPNDKEKYYVLLGPGGVGLRILQALAAEKDTAGIFVGGFNPKELEVVEASQSSLEVYTRLVDVESEDEVKSFTEWVDVIVDDLKADGKSVQIDGLFYTIGTITPPGKKQNLKDEDTYEDYQRVMRINTFAFMQFVDWIMPIFKKQGNGLIIPISSIAGFFVQRGARPYGESKKMLTDYMLMLFGNLSYFNGKNKTNIRANCMTPRMMITNMTAEMCYPKHAENLGKNLYFFKQKTIHDPQQAADVVMSLMKSGAHGECRDECNILTNHLVSGNLENLPWVL